MPQRYGWNPVKSEFFSYKFCSLSQGISRGNDAKAGPIGREKLTFLVEKLETESILNKLIECEKQTIVQVNFLLNDMLRNKICL